MVEAASGPVIGIRLLEGEHKLAHHKQTGVWLPDEGCVGCKTLLSFFYDERITALAIYGFLRCILFAGLAFNSTKTASKG